MNTRRAALVRPTPRPRTLADITIRKIVLDTMHKEAEAVGFRFTITAHFLERINARAIDQDEVFMQFLRVFRLVLSRRVEFLNQIISVQIGPHYFFLTPTLQQIVCQTYYFNAQQQNNQKADRKFVLKEKKDDV